MVGALTRRRYAEGGEVPPDDTSGMPPPELRMAALRDAGGPPPSGPPAPAGALSQPGAATAQATDAGTNLLQGALTKMGPDAQAKDAAARGKAQAIQNAMAVLQAGHAAQTTNLPLLAFGAGMMAPTHTGSLFEGISHGIDQAIPQVTAQRQRDTDYALASGKLGIAASDTDLQRAQSAAEDTYKQMQLGSSLLGHAVTADTWGQRIAGQNNRAADANQTRLMIAGAGNELKQALAGITDSRARDIATQNWFIKQGILDEKTQHDVWLEANGTARTGIAATNAGTSQDRAQQDAINKSIAQKLLASGKDPLTGQTRMTFAQAKKEAESEYAGAHAKPGAAPPPPPAASPLEDFAKPPPAPAGKPSLDQIIPGSP